MPAITGVTRLESPGAHEPRWSAGGRHARPDPRPGRRAAHLGDELRPPPPDGPPRRAEAHRARGDDARHRRPQPDRAYLPGAAHVPPGGRAVLLREAGPAVRRGGPRDP